MWISVYKVCVICRLNYGFMHTYIGVLSSFFCISQRTLTSIRSMHSIDEKVRMKWNLWLKFLACIAMPMSVYRRRNMECVFVIHTFVEFTDSLKQQYPIDKLWLPNIMQKNGAGDAKFTHSQKTLSSNLLFKDIEVKKFRPWL